MKRAIIICLTLLSLLVFDSTAEAGRRKERRAARKGGGGGVYAGAYQRQSSSGGAYPVAKASYAEVDVAPVVVATSNTDLSVEDIAVEDNTLCVTVKNVGPTASPACRLEIAIAKPQAAAIEVQNVRVLPLLPNQAVKIRFAVAPPAGSQVDALVDPDDSLAEITKENNILRAMLVDPTLASEPPLLTDEAT